MPEERRGIEEITTIGRRMRRPEFRGGLFEFASLPFGIRGDDLELGLGAAGFVAPGVPAAIDEIIATAKRPTTVPRPGTSLARTGLAGIVAGGIGFIAAEFLREISQSRLDEAGQLATRPVLAPPDTPVVVTQPEVLPEVVVTASRTTGILEALRRYVIPPAPQFFPREADPDPFIMQPIGPAPALPRPEVKPDVTTVPRPIIPRPTRSPSVPLRRPFVVPLPIPTPTFEPRITPQRSPAPLPRVRPATNPLTRPSIAPRPSVRPSPSPRIAPRPLTRVGTDLLPLPFARPGPQPRPRCRPCPPRKRCKKKEDEKELRTTCFKKLVKEHMDPDSDESFNWVEIDCLSGKEIG